MTRPWSLRARLLWGVLLPVALLFALSTFTLYRQALKAADTAYDRTLLASAKAIGEQLEVAPGGTLQAAVPYSALEAFEADNRSRMFFKVSGFQGEMVSGFADLPSWSGPLPDQSIYAALVGFFDARYRGENVRVAVLLQPVAGVNGQGMATIQVAETLEIRHALAQQLLRETLWREALLLAVVGGVLLWAVHHATRPVRELSRQVAARDESDLTPITGQPLPQELQPLVDATNQTLSRLAHVLQHQKRFVRDTSHQLRTPLAVLKVQVQSAQRGDVPAQQALQEISHTVEGATRLANQMLALAKVEQLRQQGDAHVHDWAELLHAVAMDVAPLVAEKNLDFQLELETALVPLHEWALRELTRNLLHNAIKFSPPGGALHIRLQRAQENAVLRVTDDGPGIPPQVRQHLFEPFSSGSPGGSGLGLAICREIVQGAGGTITLRNLPGKGLEVLVALALVENPADERTP
jgi:two-component system, OmpR family, sensor histidine kinase TctE